MTSSRGTRRTDWKTTAFNCPLSQLHYAYGPLGRGSAPALRANNPPASSLTTSRCLPPRRGAGATSSIFFAPLSSPRKDRAGRRLMRCQLRTFGQGGIGNRRFVPQKPNPGGPLLHADQGHRAGFYSSIAPRAVHSSHSPRNGVRISPFPQRRAGRCRVFGSKKYQPVWLSAGRISGIRETFAYDLVPRGTANMKASAVAETKINE